MALFKGDRRLGEDVIRVSELPLSSRIVLCN